MRRARSPRGKVWKMAFFLTALLVVAGDQISKYWIRSNLAGGESLPETGLFRLTHINNTGAAFGLFQDQSFLLTIAAFTGIVLILLFVLTASRYFPFLDSTPGKMALGLVLGGTIGNLIDRLRFGYITDFIDIGIWPIFNLADSAVTVGVILFAYFFLSSSGANNPSQPEQPE
ncbi:signal peptidase II [Chloroflexota bacterium]